MDWAHDDACLSSEVDLKRFTYEARSAVVIKVVGSNTVSSLNPSMSVLTNSRSLNRKYGA